MPELDPRDQVTALLREWRTGSHDASERLISILYPELMRLARRQMRGERKDHTLQATELVHEAYLRLAGLRLEWADRRHFLCVAATAMRRVLVDHARRAARQKRIRPGSTVTLADDLVIPTDGVRGLLALDEALGRLESVDLELHRILEWHFFAGLSYEEIGAELQLSPATIGRRLRLGRAWLRSELERQAPPPS